MDVSFYLYRKYQELLIFHIHPESDRFPLIGSLMHYITHRPYAKMAAFKLFFCSYKNSLTNLVRKMD